MTTQHEIDLGTLPEYHVVAAEARRQQSRAVRHAAASAAAWLASTLTALMTDREHGGTERLAEQG